MVSKNIYICRFFEVFSNGDHYFVSKFISFSLMIHEDQPLKGLLSFDFRCIQNPLENTFLDPGLSSQVQRSPLRLCWVLSQQAISLKCAVKFKFVKFSSLFSVGYISPAEMR